MPYITKLAGVSGGFYRAHKIVKSMFPGEQHTLFQDNMGHLTILSEAPRQTEPFDPEVEIRSEGPVEYPKAGEIVPFVFRCNPTKRDKKSRKRVALDDIGAKAWVERKLAASGVEVLAMSMAHEGMMSDVKGEDQKIFFASYIVSGVFTVKDSDVLSSAVSKGIGPGKAMGWGFLNVFR